MKAKFLLLTILVLLGGGAWAYWQGYIPLAQLFPPKASGGALYTQWLPEDTSFFLHLADRAELETAMRGSKLHALIHEPEIQAFFEKPLAELNASPVPESSGWMEKWDAWQVQGGFAAMTLVEGRPQVVVGLRSEASPEELRQLSRDLLAELKAQHPIGTSDLIQHGVAVEVFSAPTLEVCYAILDDGLILSANSLDLLREILDRQGVGPGVVEGGSLQQKPKFTEGQARLNQHHAVKLYVDLGSIFEVLLPILELQGLPTDQTDELSRIQHLTYGWGINEKGLFHDTLFADIPDLVALPTGFGRNLAALTPETLLYLGMQLDEDLALDGLEDLAAPGGGAEAFGPLVSWLQQMAGLGYSSQRLGDILGREIAFALEWPRNVMQPQFGFAISLADQAEVLELTRMSVESLRAQTGQQWTEQALDHGTLFRQPAAVSGLAALFTGGGDQTSVAVGSDALVVGSVPAVANAWLELYASETPSQEVDLTNFPAAVPGETMVFWLDSAGLTGRAIDSLRPFLMLMSGFVGDTVDMSKFPSTQAITQHLSPITSQARDFVGGTMVESEGIITPATAFGALLSTSAAALWLFSENEGGLDAILMPQTPEPVQAPVIDEPPAPIFTPEESMDSPTDEPSEE